MVFLPADCCSGRGRPATDCFPPGVSVRQICIKTYSTPLPTNARMRSHDSPKINHELYKLFRHREQGGMVQAMKSPESLAVQKVESGGHTGFFLTCKWGLHRALMTTELICCDLYFKLYFHGWWDCKLYFHEFSNYENLRIHERVEPNKQFGVS